MRRETGGKLETGFRRQKKGDRRGFYDVKAGVNKKKIVFLSRNFLAPFIMIRLV